MIIEEFESPPKEWNKFVKNHPEHKLYHLAEWSKVVSQTFGHKNTYLIARQQGEICGVLPITRFSSLLFGKFAVSLPFINYGGALLNERVSIAPFFNYLANFREKHQLSFVELRNDSPLDTYFPCKTHKVTFFMELPDNPDVLMKSFKAKLRSQIKRPTKEGMFAKKGGRELLDDFYRVFSINMKELGTPVLPKKFFRNIFTHFSASSFIVVVYTPDHKPVAASFLLKYREIMEIPWASSIRAFNRFSPNMLLYWSSFEVAMENECSIFDFGRCTPNSGTYRFKKQWGAKESQLYWYYVLPENEVLPELNPSNPKFELLIKIWQKLPVLITNTVGPHIIKNIP
ncbi:MAG: FemAB family PEP-CTERM system-associated protein [Calditrichaeota bacterium]|nr:MAG: FemAB family PEP-CTERM system-associated protein [Calditrichota bacterium]